VKTFKTLADIEAFEEIPLKEHKLPSNTYEMISRGVAINPKATALEFFLQGTDYKNSVSWSYKQLIGIINQTANMFYNLGINKNDVVSMLLPSVPQAHFTIWGTEAVGIVNPINPLLEENQIAEIMNAAGTKVLVTTAPFPKVSFIWDKVEAIRDQVPSLETILTVDLSGYLGSIKKGIVKLITLREKNRINKGKQKIFDFDQLLKKYPNSSLLNKRIIHPDDTASLFHTGGTTGTPKLAKHTHRNEVFDAWVLGQYQSLESGFVIFCGLPLFHVNAVIVTGLMPFGYGCKVVLGTPAGYRGEGVVDNFWKIVQYYKLNTFSGVPTLYSALLDVPIEKSDISTLEYAACGAAPMPVELFQEFEKRTNVAIVEGYGLTEGTCVSSVNPKNGERRIGSVGPHLPYQPFKTVQLDSDKSYLRDCDVDEIGAVMIRGANIFPGYTDEKHNQNIWVDLADGGGPWLNTGDLGRLDQDGYLWLTGREKELIIRGGHNIDPKLIEDPLQSHPEVNLAAAVGRPNARVGELPVAYVQLKVDSTVTVKELLIFTKEHISERAALPKEIILVDELPLTTVGKIFKPQLVWLEVEKVYSDTITKLDGVDQVSVKVDADKVHGTLAMIELKLTNESNHEKVEQKIRQRLGSFTIHYELNILN